MKTLDEVLNALPPKRRKKIDKRAASLTAAELGTRKSGKSRVGPVPPKSKSASAKKRD